MHLSFFKKKVMFCLPGSGKPRGWGLGLGLGAHNKVWRKEPKDDRGTAVLGDLNQVTSSFSTLVM